MQIGLPSLTGDLVDQSSALVILEEKNFGMKHNFLKYLMESCRQSSNEQVSIKYFRNFAFVRQFLLLEV